MLDEYNCQNWQYINKKWGKQLICRIWRFINEKSYQGRCRFKDKYAPSIVTCKCTYDGCHSFYRFIKNEFIYQLIAAEPPYTHNDEPHELEGEPIEKFVLQFISELISGLEKKEYTLKYSLGATICQKNGIKYIYTEYFLIDWFVSWKKA